eukprot:CAMPEP_0176489626 /NCGR_PEP_ID=MMETSP0200_2-20121128/7398_1 /TAXON_ID=947934 /ORGANISM="Chaetoceros sp., Strain GSL56" /LENGTH=240 /DNA_ID=CAMNT_0017886799 /DNA_START=259 /DNA_END=978 /DNA_ORIENTATION=-
MPRGVKKENLPLKQCVTCGRQFTWRKKWERCWDEVTTCSKSCNRKRRMQNKPIQQEQEMMSSSFTDFDFNTHGEMIGVESHPTIGVYDDDHEDNNDDDDDNNNNNEAPSPNTVTMDEKTKSKVTDDLDNIDDIIHNFNDEQQKPKQQQQQDDNSSSSSMAGLSKNAARKAAKKLKKQQRRAQREGRGDESAGQKQCDMCGKNVDLLIRCTYEESLQWRMVCGKCWKVASGGVVDGDAAHP